MSHKGVDPSINVVALILVTLTLGVAIIALRVTRYRGRRRRLVEPDWPAPLNWTQLLS